MTLEKVSELAKQAGAAKYVNRHYPEKASFGFMDGQLQAFAQLVRNEAMEEAAKILEGSAFMENGILHRQTQHAGSWQEKSTVGLFVSANTKKIRNLKS